MIQKQLDSIHSHAPIKTGCCRAPFKPNQPVNRFDIIKPHIIREGPDVRIRARAEIISFIPVILIHVHLVGVNRPGITITNELIELILKLKWDANCINHKGVVPFGHILELNVRI